MGIIFRSDMWLIECWLHMKGYILRVTSINYTGICSVIRRANVDDCIEIGNLIKNELGYENLDFNKFRERLERMSKDENHLSYVAVDIDSGRVVGFIGLQKGIAYESDGDYLRIILLAVKKEYQRQEIGKKLVDTAEFYASESNIPYVSVNSPMFRVDAHAFYENCGYQKKWFNFKKILMNRS